MKGKSKSCWCVSNWHSRPGMLLQTLIGSIPSILCSPIIECFSVPISSVLFDTRTTFQNERAPSPSFTSGRISPGLHQLWAWSRQMQLQALNIILPILTVCKPKYCFDSSNIIVSLEIRYCESYSLILLFEKLFKCFSPLHFHVNFGDISIKIMLFLIKVVLFIHWFLAESPS